MATAPAYHGTAIQFVPRQDLNMPPWHDWLWIATLNLTRGQFDIMINGRIPANSRLRISQVYVVWNGIEEIRWNGQIVRTETRLFMGTTDFELSRLLRVMSARGWRDYFRVELVGDY